MLKTGIEAICLSLDLSTSTSTSTSDAAAKSALSFPITRMKLHATDMYPRITKLIFDEWQEVWNCCAGNKLHAIRPTVGGYKQKTCLSRRDSVLLNRLRIWSYSSNALFPTLS